MNNEISEILKEFKINVKDVDYPIFGRVIKVISKDSDLLGVFQWEVSHYYRPIDGGGVYKPSQVCAETKERAEELLLKYIENFTNLDIEKNTNY